MSKPWTIEEGVAFVRRLQGGAFERGFNLSLGGGVLNNGASEHDLDVVVAPSAGKDVVEENMVNRLIAWLLAEGGLTEAKRKRWNYTMKVVTGIDGEGHQVDFFVVGEFSAHKDIFADMVETLELAVRSARRCAYDLRHAADRMYHPSPEDAALFGDRANHYVKLFQSGSSMKDYRHSLHREIDELESKLERVRKVLAEHKIEDPTADLWADPPQP